MNVDVIFDENDEVITANVEDGGETIPTNFGGVSILGSTPSGNFADVFRLEGMIAEVNGKCETNKGNISTNAGDIDDLEDKCKTNSDNITALGGRCGTIEGDIGTIKGDVGTIKGDIGTIKDDVGPLKDKCNTNADNITNLTNSVDKFVNPNIRWCAMGDSITWGTISYLTDGVWKPNWSYRQEGWAFKMAALKNWDLDNRAVSGTGYMNHHINEDGTKVNDAAWNKAEEIAGQTLNGVKGFKRYDIVTIMYGVNDWAGNMYKLGSLGDPYNPPTTIIGGIRKTIDTIIESNPLCKIVVITPLNRKGVYYDDVMNEADNWALGYTKSQAKSLEDIFQGIKSVCEYYGIEMIDMTHSSIVNRKSLPNCLPDDTHPTKEVHSVIAKELSSKILFG